MTTPRSKLVDSTVALHYHIVSRCVRQAWLCGKKAKSKKDYSQRKHWLEQRMFHLAKYFAVEIDAYAILANHFHMVVYFDPTACKQWTVEEVAFRWVEAFPPTKNGCVCEDLKLLQREKLVKDETLLEDRRKKLGCLSTFMKHLKQPIALRANSEDGCKGHFFEKRFYSGALLNEQAVLASMAYVDLNPVRAKIARSITQCQNTSIAKRLEALENSIERLKVALEPVVSGLGEVKSRVEITLSEYIARLDEIIKIEVDPATQSSRHKQSRWFAQVASIRKRQRAFGSSEALAAWIGERALKRAGSAMPE